VTARLVGSYLLTNETAIRNLYGLYPRPMSAITHDLGLAEDEIAEALEDLAAASFAHMDEPSGWIWVESVTEDRVLRGRGRLAQSDAACGAAQAWWRGLEPNPLLVPYEARYGQALHLRAAGTVRRELQLVKPVQGTLLANQTSTAPTERRLMSTALQQAERFQQWWEGYPMKVGKGKAREVWMRVKPEWPDVMEGLARWQRSQKWAEDFIVLPAVWIQQRRWEDDPPPATGGRTWDVVHSLRAGGGLFDAGGE
jgi:hypothetical protein